MKRSVLWFALGASVASATAVEVPLQFRKLTMEEAFACPGGYGLYGGLETGNRQKPTREPPAVSKHAIYGLFYRDAGPPEQRQMLFRLDESKGDGKGYDRLIVDANGNRDLTDDAVAEKVGVRPGLGGTRESARFGPLEWPENVEGTSLKPVLYAEMDLYNRAGLARENEYVGNLRLRAGWLLEGTVELDGVKEKVAFYDANCSSKLADPPEVSKIYRGNDRDGAWYLSPRDYVLRDADRPPQAKGAPYATAESWYRTVYFDGKPYTVTINQTLTSARVEPFSGPIGSFALDPRMGELELARNMDGKQWEPISPQVRDGKVTVPAGSYRLVDFKLMAKDDQGVTYQVGSQKAPEKVFEVAEGKTERLPYGLPIDLKVSARKDRGQGGGIMGVARSLFGGASGKSSVTLVMDLAISGPAQESYSEFYRREAGQSTQSMISSPRFRVLDAEGKQVASGTFEFG